MSSEANGYSIVLIEYYMASVAPFFTTMHNDAQLTLRKNHASFFIITYLTCCPESLHIKKIRKLILRL